MPAPSECCRPCNTPVATQVPGPEGAAGDDGANGVNGSNAFTLVTEAFVVPAIGNNVTATVGDSSFAAIEQVLFVEDAGYFGVVSVPSATSIQLEYLDYEFNTFAGDPIGVGAKVTPSGTQGPSPTIPDSQIAAYGSGTEYALTSTPAAVVLGGASPDLVLTAPGTWLILARARIDYNAATFAAVRTVTVTLRRVNNTAGNLPNASASLETQIITALTFTAGVMGLPPIIYQTANSDDQIQMWASIDVVPSVGTISIPQCEIVAVLISPTTP